ncbi:MAG: aminotransferase class V-fold PLP-dependent enzyme, partial [Phycisphaerales bacterium]|nr:aminotransferase class V-fold PLP-dependent enzyme [Phycisphaerales bacterium]
SHKWHGPKGVGVLWARPGVRLAPRLVGTQENGRRGGTENTSAIVGAGVAARLALQWVADPALREAQRALRDRFERAVLSAVPEARVNGPTDPSCRLWNTANIAFPRLEAEALLMAFSERGLCASAGAACSSGSLDPSPVLLAMGVPPELAHGSVRFSLSRESTADEIDRAAAVVTEGVQRVGSSMTG